MRLPKRGQRKRKHSNIAFFFSLEITFSPNTANHKGKISKREENARIIISAQIKTCQPNFSEKLHARKQVWLSIQRERTLNIQMQSLVSLNKSHILIFF